MAVAARGQRLKGILLLHLVFASLSALMIWTVWLLRRHAQRNGEGTLPAYCLAIEAFGVLLVALTGHLGGFLSGVNLPN